MKRALQISGAFLVINLVLFLYCLFAVYHYSKQYFETKADVAIVLGAGVKNGQVSNVFKEHLNHAQYLYQNQWVLHVIVTGGLSPNECLSDSEIGANYLTQFGVPSQNIFAEKVSSITFENIRYAKNIMDNNGFKTALIVSDPYHMLRAMKMCQKAGLTALPSPTQTSAYQSKKTKRKFLINQAWNYYVYVLFKRFRTTQ